MPSSVLGGKNSNENAGVVSSSAWSIRIARNLTKVVSRFIRLVRRDDVQVDGGPLLAALRVVHVDGVVLPIGADQPDEHRGPAPETQAPLLGQRLVEQELVA